MQYHKLLQLLNENADMDYRAFHKKLLKNDKINVIGVRIPTLRKIARLFKGGEDELMTFPDEYYEVTFVKLTAISKLPYEKFFLYIDRCVELIDNWATCDCFVPKCVVSHKNEFLLVIHRYLSCDNEFKQRFALTTLLHFYAGEQYSGQIFDCVQNADNKKYYYVHMASAWLIAEMLVKCYDSTVQFLKASKAACGLKNFDNKTHNKAIQKAVESYRLSAEQKYFLKELKFR